MANPRDNLTGVPRGTTSAARAISCDASYVASPDVPGVMAPDRGGRPTADLLRQIASAPAIDRMPIILGSSITLASLHAAMQQSLTGYRQRLVDMLDELVDLEPHGVSVYSKRFVAIAGGRMEITPAEVVKEERDRAQEICTLVKQQVEGIPYRTEHFYSLLWADLYGITGSEILWEHPRASEWNVTGLQDIHSRRLSYPDFSRWDLYVWDQGAVMGPDPLMAPTTGLRIADFPNKFLVYSPRLRGNYPTREGHGRILAVYWCLKRLVLRIGAQDFERFTKPWVIAYFSTVDEATGKPTPAEREDILAGDRAVKALGAGSLAGVTLPDSIKIDLLNAASKLDFFKFLKYIDDATTKLAIGSTMNTEPGQFGNKGGAQQGKEDAREISRYGAQTFCDMLRQDLAGPIARLNFGADTPARLIPQLKIHIERPDPQRILEIATKAAEFDIPVDGRAIAQEIGMPLVPSFNEPEGPKGDDGKPKPKKGDADKLPDIRMRPLKADAVGGDGGTETEADTNTATNGGKQPGDEPDDTAETPDVEED